MQNTIEYLKKKGIVLTPQRIEIINILKDKKIHLTADEIYSILKKKFPTISFATVYNILQKFIESGEIQGLHIVKEKVHYDGNPCFHHHFYCERCERIYDIEIECPYSKQKYISGHKINYIQAHFYGICKTCEERSHKN